MLLVLFLRRRGTSWGLRWAERCRGGRRGAAACACRGVGRALHELATQVKATVVVEIACPGAVTRRARDHVQGRAAKD